MAFCSKCGYEYKPEIGVCPDCGETLVASLSEGADRRGSPQDSPQWKLLYNATSRTAAEFLKETLDASGIDSVVKYRGSFFGRGVSHGLGAVAGAVDAEVWVLEEQFEEARKIRRQTVGDEDTSHGFLPKE